MMQYRKGKPQDNIKIKQYKDGYFARFYVRGSPLYIETLTARISQEGEHFILNYKNTQLHLVMRPESPYEYPEKEVYHDKTKAHTVAVDKIKKDVQRLMVQHDMPEAKNVTFEIIERN
jgi:hypothetical protein